MAAEGTGYRIVGQRYTTPTDETAPLELERVAEVLAETQDDVLARHPFWARRLELTHQGIELPRVHYDHEDRRGVHLAHLERYLAKAS